VENGLPFKDGSFAAIIVPIAVVEYIKHKLELIIEVKRMLAADGSAFFSTVRGLIIGELEIKNFFDSLNVEPAAIPLLA